VEGPSALSKTDPPGIDHEPLRAVARNSDDARPFRPNGLIIHALTLPFAAKTATENDRIEPILSYSAPGVDLVRKRLKL
jgi:hypothetical protein